MQEILKEHAQKAKGNQGSEVTRTLGTNKPRKQKNCKNADH